MKSMPEVGGSIPPMLHHKPEAVSAEAAFHVEAHSEGIEPWEDEALEAIAKGRLLSRMMLAEDQIASGDVADFDAFAAQIRERYGL